MPVPHLLDTYQLSAHQIEAIVAEAHGYLRQDGSIADAVNTTENRRIVLAFFESSTRTRLSFEAAAQRLGVSTSTFVPAGSSLEKGESLQETLKTIQAMGFDAIVFRHATNGVHHELAATSGIPIINAGEGSRAHPTQALLDASTLIERFGNLSGLKVCLVGDIQHSRVARSNVDVFKKLDVEVSLCGPPQLMPELGEFDGVPHIASIDEAIEWADVMYLLRIQHERLERHDIPTADEYKRRYALTSDRLRSKRDIVIMHPGPVNSGVEIDTSLLNDVRSLIHRQVTHGVAVRMAVLKRSFIPRPLNLKGNDAASL